MKHHRYATRPATLVEFKIEIIRTFEKIDVAMLEFVIHNFLTRLEKVIKIDGVEGAYRKCPVLSFYLCIL